jgi:hypothetical protein
MIDGFEGNVKAASDEMLTSFFKGVIADDLEKNYYTNSSFGYLDEGLITTRAGKRLMAFFVDISLEDDDQDSREFVARKVCKLLGIYDRLGSRDLSEEVFANRWNSDAFAIRSFFQEGKEKDLRSYRMFLRRFPLPEKTLQFALLHLHDGNGELVENLIYGREGCEDVEEVEAELDIVLEELRKAIGEYFNSHDFRKQLLQNIELYASRFTRNTEDPLSILLGQFEKKHS